MAQERRTKGYNNREICRRPGQQEKVCSTCLFFILAHIFLKYLYILLLQKGYSGLSLPASVCDAPCVI